MGNTGCECLWNLICLVIAIAVAGFVFDYSLNIYFGKDIPWYGDCLAGIFASPVAVPAAVIGFVLECCGIPAPFFHV